MAAHGRTGEDKIIEDMEDMPTHGRTGEEKVTDRMWTIGLYRTGEGRRH